MKVKELTKISGFHYSTSPPWVGVTGLLFDFLVNDRVVVAGTLVGTHGLIFFPCTLELSSGDEYYMRFIAWKDIEVLQAVSLKVEILSPCAPDDGIIWNNTQSMPSMMEHEPLTFDSPFEL